MNTRKTNWRFWLSLAIMVLLVPLAVVLFTRLKQSFYLSGLTIIVLTIAAFFLHFESRKPQARELAQAMCGVYLPLPHADAGRLSAAVKATAGI